MNNFKKCHNELCDEKVEQIFRNECELCGEYFCGQCIETIGGRHICEECKDQRSDEFITLLASDINCCDERIKTLEAAITEAYAVLAETKMDATLIKIAYEMGRAMGILGWHIDKQQNSAA